MKEGKQRIGVREEDAEDGSRPSTVVTSRGSSQKKKNILHFHIYIYTLR